MSSFMSALVAHPQPKKKTSTSRVRRYHASPAVVKARAFNEAHAELSVRAGTCYDVSNMTRIDGSMSRAEAVAALLGISLEAAAAML